MKILSVETSSSICSVSILEDNKIIKEISNNDGNTHSVKLMPQIKQIFEETGLTLNDIDLLACDKGPGSFTGIRIGISTVKAFADVINIPTVGISSLLALAYNSNYSGYICSLIDAKNNNVYYGLFDNSSNKYVKVGEYLAENINSITEILKICNKPIFFVGNGSIVYKDVLKSSLGKNAIFAKDCDCNLSSINVGISAFYAYSNNLTNNKEYILSPMYLKKSNAERDLEKNPFK